MKISRPKFLKVGLVGAAALALPLGTLSIPLTREPRARRFRLRRNRFIT